MVGTLEDISTKRHDISQDVEDLAVDLEGATYETFDWRKYFSDPQFEFHGNIPNASQLMESFIKGMTYVKEQKEKENSDLPEIIFTLGEPLKEKNIYYTRDIDNKPVVAIAKSYIEKVSSFNPQQNLQLELPNHKIIMEGSFSQIFELTGVEETFHALFESENPEKDATDWKIKYANEHRFPRATINYLRKELLDLRNSTRGERKKKRP
jgi:hypothetical protein